MIHDDSSTQHEPVIPFRGTKVGLGPQTREMIPLIHKWISDPEHCMWAGDPFLPVPRERFEEEKERSLKELNPQKVEFGIFDLETRKPIGLCVLRNIAQIDGLAEFGIAIGEKEYLGEGRGTEATALALDFAFNVLGMYNVSLTVAAYNERARKAYEKVGFKLIGRRRGARKLGAKRYDLVLMDCLATEFKSPLPPIVPQPPQE